MDEGEASSSTTTASSTTASSTTARYHSIALHPPPPPPPPPLSSPPPPPLRLESLEDNHQMDNNMDNMKNLMSSCEKSNILQVDCLYHASVSVVYPLVFGRVAQVLHMSYWSTEVAVAVIDFLDAHYREMILSSLSSSFPWGCGDNSLSDLLDKSSKLIIDNTGELGTIADAVRDVAFETARILSAVGGGGRGHGHEDDKRMAFVGVGTDYGEGVRAALYIQAMTFLLHRVGE